MVGRLILPGEFIGTEEEFIAGQGTFEENGRVYSSNLGNVEVGADYKVKVRSRREEIVVQSGDEIIGVVTEINEPLVVVAGEYLIREGKVYQIKARALVHASRITGHYLDQCSKVVKARDVVRGKVVSTRGKIDLTMEPPDEGVIYAYCSHCRKPLQRINSGLYCTYCQKNEIRKVSKKYGELSEGVKKNED